MDNTKTIIKLLKQAKNIIIIQAENPDGDSLGSALALDDIFHSLGKKTSLYCPVDLPKYLRYIKGWDLVDKEFDTSADLAIIVDTSVDILLTKATEKPAIKAFLKNKPIIVIDHHTNDSQLSFEHYPLSDSTAVSSGEIIYKLALKQKWPISQTCAENILITILSDSLGLTTEAVKPETYLIAGQLAELGANSYAIETRRREFMKKPAEILQYKGRLIERLEYYLDGRLALVQIPFEEIKAYSDRYNPSMLVLDEMRLVEGVEVGVAIKTYPDGKLTAKIRSNQPVSDQIAGYFGGGGHAYASGFRVYESFDNLLPELLTVVDKTLQGKTK